MSTPELREKWETKLETIQDAYDVCQIELSEWEGEFIDSVSLQLAGGKDLSFKQSSCLSKIYNRIG